MRIPNFNLFDTMAAAGMYDPSIGTTSNNKTNHIQNGNYHNGQHIYSPNNDYVPSSLTTSNGYWPYTTQPYFSGSARQYMVNQTPSTSVSDTCSSPSQQDLSYHTYPHMQKMVENYSTSYEFYQQQNAKYC
jgi:hypothetical protein